MTGAEARTRVLVLGGGFIGLYAARKLHRLARAGKIDLTLVNPENFMVYQPFLPEAASGTIEPRHVLVPLRRALKRGEIISGVVTGLDHPRRLATIRPVEGEPYELPYDVVIIGLGSVSRLLPIPGLRERAIGFKTVAEAVYLRNHIVSRIEVAETTTDPQARRRALTFVFVGAGYSGVEALAELEDFARGACRYYRNVTREDMRWVLVEAAAGILPEIGPRLSRYVLQQLEARGIEVHLATRLESAEGRMIRLSSGETLEADTLVWTAGVRPHPLLAKFGLPLDERGRVVTDEYLRVQGTDGAWAAGDCAAVPDLRSGGLCPPTAQHAMRQGRRLGKNVARALRARRPKAFRHRNLGQLVGLGRYKGVARIPGMRFRGFVAWLLQRSYHLLAVPTLNRKLRVMVDWGLTLFLGRDVVHLGALRPPARPVSEATGEIEPAETPEGAASS